jgi:hypothetical protein
LHPAPLSDFKATLPTLKSTITSAIQERLTVSSKVVDDLSRKLATVDSTTPDYWPTAFELITYRSQIATSWDQQVNTLPSCNEQMHRFKATWDAPADQNGRRALTHGPVELHDCQITLDSPEAMQNISVDLSIASVIFRHCVVFYHGGPIVLFPVKVATETPAKLVGSLRFEDCLFIFSLPQPPSSQGQQFAQHLLLASSLSSVEFKPQEG